LAALAAIGPFAIDAYLPAFQAMGADLGASQHQVQQSLTAYLLPFALMSLWHGALSDRFGRRAVVVAALAVFMLASLAVMFATTIEHLWLARALQGISGGAGMVVSRAVVRDVAEGPAAQRLMAQSAMMFALAPAIAPIIGGWVLALAGWRAIFGFLTLYSALLIVAILRFLPETLAPERRQSLHPVWLAKSYWGVFTRPAFLHLAIALALNFAGFFIYVLSAPVFLMQHLGVSAQGFAWLFVPTVTGMMTGSWLSGRVADHLSARTSVTLGYAVMVAAATANVVLNALTPPQLPWPVLPLMLYNLGMALAMPALQLLIIDLLPQQRGLISSCQGFACRASPTPSARASGAAPVGFHAHPGGGPGGPDGLGLLLFVTVRPESAPSAAPPGSAPPGSRR